jgi:uncharacterized protein YecE (DUF72 family)
MGPPEIHNKPMARLFAGTSGFAYAQWKPRFYPAKLPANKFLEHYAQRLNSVEINYTFRRMPSAATLENWVAATPPGFRVRFEGAHAHHAHHAAEECGGSHGRFSARHRSVARGAAAGAGAVSASAADALRHGCAAGVLEILPEDLRYAFEFRHASWLVDEVYRLLEGRNISLCVAESEKLEVPEVITADFVYYRLRKPEYTAEDVESIAARAQDCWGRARICF